MHDSFYKNGLHFSCTGCSACCRHDPGFVYLSENDLERLLEWARLPREVFIRVYCRWVPRGDGFEYLCLREKSNFDCILWDIGCIAYESRPLQCSAYPFWPSTLMDEDWWNASAETCPGMNNGRLYTYEEITAFLDQRAAEPYIRRSSVTGTRPEGVV